MPERPDLLLVTTDQHRGDCLGLDPRHPVRTPFLDELALNGTRFAAAYSACPVCVPARRTLLTGTRPRTHGVLMNGWADLPFPTLPAVLRGAGYQTHLVGKLHFQPSRARHGFDSADWADAPWHHDDAAARDNDYFRFLARNGVDSREAQAHGATPNGHPARPWHLDERLHYSNWAASAALDFLERRDPTCPFFLNLSFLHPHQPLTPPRDYLDKYLRPEVEIPPPDVGEWVDADAGRGPIPVEPWRIELPAAEMRYVRAAYYATIEHLDAQIGRVLRALPRGTVVLFTSDHGEMLGDHRWLRKRTPWEPSARVPMLLAGPGVPRGRVDDRPVELMDVMPTLLGAAGVAVPESVEGMSLLGHDRREYVHGECAAVPTTNSGMQYVTDGRRKFCWWPGRGEGQFFDLEADPRELRDRIDDPSRADQVARWRSRLVAELDGRPEGFVVDGRLAKLAGPTPVVLPAGR